MGKKVLFTAIIISMLAMGCRQPETTKEERTVSVEIMVIDSIESGVTRTYVGEVTENAAVSLNFPLGGTVQQVRVHEGDYVRTGDLLVSIDKASAQSSYDAAKAALNQAEDGYKRLKQVYEQGSVAEVKWVDMQTKLEQARSMEQIAKKQLENCELRAPFSGVVGKCEAEVGENLLPGQPAVELLDISKVGVTFAVPENEISNISLRRNAKVAVPALPDFSFVGQISQKSVTSNRISHSYQVQIDVPNGKNELMPGMVCKVYISEPNTNGYIIPSSAVQTRPEGLSVWTVRNGLAKRNPITSTEFVANGILVTSGLGQGDTVVIAGQQKLYDDAKVICSKKVK